MIHSKVKSKLLLPGVSPSIDIPASEITWACKKEQQIMRRVIPSKIIFD